MIHVMAQAPAAQDPHLDQDTPDDAFQQLLKTPCGIAVSCGCAVAGTVLKHQDLQDTIGQELAGAGQDLKQFLVKDKPDTLVYSLIERALKVTMMVTSKMADDMMALEDD